MKGLGNWQKSKPKCVDGSYSHSEEKKPGLAWLRCLWSWGRFEGRGRQPITSVVSDSTAPLSCSLGVGSCVCRWFSGSFHMWEWSPCRWRSHAVITAGKSSLQTKDSSQILRGAMGGGDGVACSPGHPPADSGTEICRTGLKLELPRRSRGGISSSAISSPPRPSQLDTYTTAHFPDPLPWDGGKRENR